MMLIVFIDNGNNDSGDNGSYGDDAYNILLSTRSETTVNELPTLDTISTI